MRLLLVLLLAAVGAYFTVPTREAHETAAREFLRGHQPAQPSEGISLEQVANYVQGMLAGQGRYENWYVASKYSVDMPGSAFLECYGAFTIVRCSEAGAAASD